MLKKGCGCNKSANVTPELPKDWGIPKINLNPIEDPCKKPWDCPDIQPAVQIVNNPDNEDITSVQVGTSDVLKFADKVYDPLVFSGMGRVFLRKNLVDDNSSLSCASKVNKLEQSMFEDKNGQPLTNTIFIVQYDYDLQGAFITIPCNSILLFLGGSFSNGTVILTNTLVLPHMLEYSKYMNCAIKGSFAKGQTFYSDGVIKVWNGSSWVEFAGSDSDYSELLSDLETRLTQLASKVTKNTTDIATKIDKGSLGTINSQSIENGHSIVIEGGEGGGTISIPLATSQIRGGIKIGYQQNGLNIPVKLNNKEQAYVTIPNQASSTEALNLRVGNLESSYSELILSNNSLEARVKSLTESISQDGTIDLTTLESELKLYVDEQTSAAFTSLTSSYAFQHGEDIEKVVSGFQSMASPDSAFARIFAKKDDVEALVKAEVRDSIANVTINANEIEFEDGLSYIKLQNIPGEQDGPIINPGKSEVSVNLVSGNSLANTGILQYDHSGLVLKDKDTNTGEITLTHSGLIKIKGRLPIGGNSIFTTSLWDNKILVKQEQLNNIIGQSELTPDKLTIQGYSDYSELTKDTLKFYTNGNTSPSLVFGINNNFSGNYRMKVIEDGQEVVKEFWFKFGILESVEDPE